MQRTALTALHPTAAISKRRALRAPRAAAGSARRAPVRRVSSDRHRRNELIIAEAEGRNHRRFAIPVAHRLYRSRAVRAGGGGAASDCDLRSVPRRNRAHLPRRADRSAAERGRSAGRGPDHSGGPARAGGARLGGAFHVLDAFSRRRRPARAEIVVVDARGVAGVGRAARTRARDRPLPLSPGTRIGDADDAGRLDRQASRRPARASQHFGWRRRARDAVVPGDGGNSPRAAATAMRVCC